MIVRRGEDRMETRKVQEGGARTQSLEEKREDTRGWEHEADRRKTVMRERNREGEKRKDR